MRNLFGDPIAIGIIGCRKRDSVKDYLAVAKVFFGVFQPGDTVVSGGCAKGGDRFAMALAAAVGAVFVVHRPQVTSLGAANSSPRLVYAAAAYARNTLVARDARDVLIACVSPERKGGTEDTIVKWQRFHPYGELIIV